MPGHEIDRLDVTVDAVIVADAQAADDPGRELNRLDVLRGLRLSVWDGAFATVHASLTTGAFLTGFALWLGANDLALGLLTAIPTLAGLVQIVASYFGKSLGSRRAFVGWFALISRTLWLPILAAPMFLPPGAALPLFLVLFAVSFALMNATVPAWTSWMSDLVPEDHRGRYFARRNMVAGVAGMAIGLPAAWFLDLATRRHHWESAGFGVLFAVGAAGGIASFIAVMRQPEPKPKSAPAGGSRGLRGILEFYAAPFADRNFRSLLAFNTIFVSGQFFAAPFFTVYALRILHLNYLWLQVFAMLTGIASLGSMAAWGFLADKFGNKPILGIGVVGVFFLPILWILSTPGNPPLMLSIVAINSLAGGLFWAGVNLNQFNLLIRLSPPERTGVYVATLAAVTGITGGLAPLVGGIVMHGLEGWHAHLLGFAVGNFQVTFAIAALLRVVALIFLGPLRDADSTPARDVLDQLSKTRPTAWRDIQRLRGAQDEETRLRATSSLATSRTRLAVAELVAALSDPSLAVREEAAHALGVIGDPAVVPALITALRDPTTGLAGEAAQALGRIGDRQATPALAAVLADRSGPYSLEDRIRAVRALGALGGGDAVDALLRELTTAASAESESSRPEEEQEAMVRALGHIGNTKAAPALADLLQRPEVARPLRLALVRALGELEHPIAVTALRGVLPTASQDGVLFPLLADALARHGDRESVGALLQGIAAQDSPVGRRQAASAVGTLLGEGDALYALLSQEAFGRDAAIARLAEEIQRSLRGGTGAGGLSEALNAYLSEQYGRCCALLASAGTGVQARTTPPRSETAVACSAALGQAAAQAAADVPLELALIAWCALRGAVT
ncbi:MAG TPA: MFS transporter [Chthonomonadaceae bacterium]|nr:MFS transporter [Chthonomonadaceae bacterium]